MRPFLTSFLGCILAVAGVVYWADPAGRWHPTENFPSAVLARGETLVWPTNNIDERRAREVELRTGPAPDLVLLGSSRVFLLDQAMFPPEVRVFNAGVSGGTMEDFIGFWQELKENRRIPRYLVIFTDPWIFGGAYENASWHTLAPYTSRFLQSESGWIVWRAKTWAQDIWSTLSELLSWAALRESLEVASMRLRTPHTEHFVIMLEPNLDPSRYAYRADGSLIYPASMLEQHSTEEMRKVGDEFANNQRSYSLADWKPSRSSLQMLDELMKDTASQGVSLLIVFSPYQHRTLQKILSFEVRASALRSLAFEIKGAATRSDAVFCNALNPDDSGCNETEFMDGMHMLRSCAVKVISHCLSLDNRWKGLQR